MGEDYDEIIQKYRKFGEVRGYLGVFSTHAALVRLAVCFTALKGLSHDIETGYELCCFYVAFFYEAIRICLHL